MTSAPRAGFAPSPTAEKSLREGIYNDVKAARFQQNAQSGQFGNPADAMADAIRVATFASGYGGNPQDTALAFPVPPELSKETEEVLRERGLSGRTATPEQVRTARAQVRAEKPPQIAAETAARTTAERIVSRTAGGVPERASATERKEYSELAANIAGLRNLIGKLSDPEIQKVMGPILSTQPWGALRRGAGAFAPGALTEEQGKFLAQLPVNLKLTGFEEAGDLRNFEIVRSWTEGIAGLLQ